MKAMQKSGWIKTWVRTCDLYQKKPHTVALKCVLAQRYLERNTHNRLVLRYTNQHQHPTSTVWRRTWKKAQETLVGLVSQLRSLSAISYVFTRFLYKCRWCKIHFHPDTGRIMYNIFQNCIDCLGAFHDGSVVESGCPNGILRFGSMVLTFSLQRGSNPCIFILKNVKWFNIVKWMTCLTESARMAKWMTLSHRRCWAIQN